MILFQDYLKSSFSQNLLCFDRNVQQEREVSSPALMVKLLLWGIHIYSSKHCITRQHPSVLLQHSQRSYLIAYYDTLLPGSYNVQSRLLNTPNIISCIGYNYSNTGLKRQMTFHCEVLKQNKRHHIATLGTHLLPADAIRHVISVLQLAINHIFSFLFFSLPERNKCLKGNKNRKHP